MGSGIFIFAASEEDSTKSLKDEVGNSEMDTSEMTSGPRALRSSRFSSEFLKAFEMKLLKKHLNIMIIKLKFDFLGPIIWNCFLNLKNNFPCSTFQKWNLLSY